MSSVFLSHTSVDKSFVEKLAKRLTKLGVKVWFDKWEIKIGDSITWKIEEGIRENEYLGIILSQEALNSEWVKSELSAAWFKQMDSKKVVVLPIYYRNCEIPYLLRDKKYADFRENFESGLKELAEIFGIKNTEILSIENWRLFIGKNENWREYRDLEFENIVTKLTDIAIEYNWSTYVSGTKLPHSINFNNGFQNEQVINVGIRLDGKTKSYMFCSEAESNPNNMKPKDFNKYIGNTINQCEEYLWRFFEDYKQVNGNPINSREHFDYKFLSVEKTAEMTKNIVKQTRWYKGNKV